MVGARGTAAAAAVAATAVVVVDAATVEELTDGLSLSVELMELRRTWGQLTNSAPGSC